MSDIHDDEAEKLLPCYCWRSTDPVRPHHESCPAWFRPAVAARLREKLALSPQADHWKRKADEFYKQWQMTETKLVLLREQLAEARELLQQIYNLTLGM